MSTVNQIADGLLLTGSPVATSSVEAGGLDQHTLFVLYSPDTNSTNSLEVTIEYSPDNSTWFPYTGSYSDSTGTITEGSQVTLSFASAGTVDQYQAPYFFNGASNWIRLQVSETNTPGDFGNVTAWIFSNRS